MGAVAGVSREVGKRKHADCAVAAVDRVWSVHGRIGLGVGARIMVGVIARIIVHTRACDAGAYASIVTTAAMGRVHLGVDARAVADLMARWA